MKQLVRPLAPLVFPLACAVCRADLLIYQSAGNETTLGAHLKVADAFNGEMIFDIAQTNQTLVNWGTMDGHKVYWTRLATNLVITVTGSGNQNFTLLSAAGQGHDANGNPMLLSTVFQGLNTRLTPRKGDVVQFPDVFSCSETALGYSSQVSAMVMVSDQTSLIFSPAVTQAANAKNQSAADVAAALITSLEKKGYKPK
jgi:hypothetical protein